MGCKFWRKDSVLGEIRCTEEAEDFERVGIITRHTGTLKDMAIIVWDDGKSQPPEGTILYVVKGPERA